jgi:hypothetical protein
LSLEKDATTRGVQTGPGATQLTRIPRSIKRWASPLVKVTIAPLSGERASGSLLLGVCHARNVRTVTARRVRRVRWVGQSLTVDVSLQGSANLTLAPAR